MADSDMRIGWVGAGAMGLPMLGRLLRAGHAVAVHDLRPDRLRQAEALGGEPVADLRSLARTCDCLCTMVYDDAALESVVADMLPALGAGHTLVDFSTVSPAASARIARRLAETGSAYLRAPVSGSVPVAETGELAIFASGPVEVYERCLPLLRALSVAQRRVGEAEAARVVKLAINLLLVSHTALLGEALALGEAAGVGREAMMDCINGSVIGSRHTQLRGRALATRHYGTAGPVDLGAKDLDLALVLARDHTLGLPLGALVREYLTELIGDGLGGLEISLLAEFPRRTTFTPPKENQT